MRRKINLLLGMTMLAGLLCVGLLVWVPRALGQDGGTKDHGGSRVEGTVRDKDGSPVVWVDVILESKGNDSRLKTGVDSKGRFTFGNVAPGDYTLRGEIHGYAETKPKTLHVQNASRMSVDLAFESPLPIIDFADPAPVELIEFDDKPNFTVAGVTEWNNSGTHGSDVAVRTSEKLAKDAQALEGQTGSNSPSIETERGRSSAAPLQRTEKELRETREMAKASLARADLASTHRKLGELDEKLGDPLEAEREFEKAARMEPSEENYFAWGTELLLHRADEPAAEVFQQGANTHRDSARMLEGLGAALFAEGKVEEAAKKLCEAADLKPKDETAYLFLGRIQKSAVKALPCAEEKLARFARDQPESAMANYYYGLTLWRRERASGDSATTADAEAHLAKAAKLDAKFGEASLQLGILHAESWKLEQAVGDFQNAIAASPELGEAHYRLGLAYRRAKQEAKAEEEFRVYEKIEKEETAAREKERKELRQFLIILKGQPGVN
jgi:tetratricopeptide (TPR) repeat protein